MLSGAGMEQRTTQRSNEAASLMRRLNRLSSERKQEQGADDFYSTLILSSNPDFAHSTRHSLTSRIPPNSCLLSHLIFSTRQLNATPEKAPQMLKNSTFAFAFLPPLVALVVLLHGQHDAFNLLATAHATEYKLWRHKSAS
jgi:hypothetical protein